MATSLHAVTLVVPDYDEALAFYIDVVGFSLLEDIDLGHGKRWVLIATQPDSETKLLIAKADGARQDAAVGNQTGGRVGFFLATDDFEAAFDALTAKGVRFEEAPRSESYGTVAVWSDPFGNRWDLIEFSTKTRSGV